ncbi:MAG: amidohydrolase family protein [Pseudomonadota bacterium]
MLIRAAEIDASRTVDVRLRAGRIAAVGALTPEPDEPLLHARGGALLPGLHDHHLHLMSLAAALDSVRCGPPEVTSAAALAAALARQPPSHTGWIRGVGYHESVAGDLDRTWLDRHGPDAPVRIQHRSGRLWVLNSAALDALAATGPVPAQQRRHGRFLDADQWLHRLAGAAPPPLDAVSRRLAGFGVTGVTDMTPRNDAAALAVFTARRRDGSLRQRLRVAGQLSLDAGPGGHAAGLGVGETKVHLHETAFPPPDELRRTIAASHHRDRGVAIHCVTEAELAFALAAFREAGARAGDRIEHASVTPPPMLDELRALGLTVVTQPNFVAERGDVYLDDIAPAAQPWLYRCRSFLDAGIPLAGGTDAPFGDPDPWRAMRAAVTRATASGTVLGGRERLTPEQALALFTGPGDDPARRRRVERGAAADLCLLDRPWSRARTELTSKAVRATFCDGRVIFERAGSAEG